MFDVLLVNVYVLLYSSKYRVFVFLFLTHQNTTPPPTMGALSFALAVNMILMYWLWICFCFYCTHVLFVRFVCYFTYQQSFTVPPPAVKTDLYFIAVQI